MTPDDDAEVEATVAAVKEGYADAEAGRIVRVRDLLREINEQEQSDQG